MVNTVLFMFPVAMLYMYRLYVAGLCSKYCQQWVYDYSSYVTLDVEWNRYFSSQAVCSSSDDSSSPVAVHITHNILIRVHVCVCMCLWQWDWAHHIGAWGTVRRHWNDYYQIECVGLSSSLSHHFICALGEK